MHFHARLHAIPTAAALAGVAALTGCGGSGHDASQRPSAAAQTRLVVVPQLIGRRQADAHRIAIRAGLDIRWTGFAGKLANGRYNVGCVKVLRQSPVAGERRPAGSRIVVIEEACRVPREAPHGVPDAA